MGFDHSKSKRMYNLENVINVQNSTVVRCCATAAHDFQVEPMEQQGGTVGFTSQHLPLGPYCELFDKQNRSQIRAVKQRAINTSV